MLIDTDKVVSKIEIAEMAGVIPSAVSNWTVRHHSFPQPIVTLRIGALYDRVEVEAWLLDRGIKAEQTKAAQIARLEARLEKLKRESNANGNE